MSTHVPSSQRNPFVAAVRVFLRGKCWVGASTVLAVALAFPACGTYELAGSPGPPFEIRLGIISLVVSRNPLNAPNTINCEYYINARAVGGRPGDSGSWLSAESVWTFADGESKTTAWSQANLGDFFAISGLDFGEIASWWVGGPPRTPPFWTPPYTVTHRLRYSVTTGEVKTATVTLTCE